MIQRDLNGHRVRSKERTGDKTVGLGIHKPLHNLPSFFISCICLNKSMISIFSDGYSCILIALFFMYFMCTSVLLERLYGPQVYAWCSKRPKKGGIRSPRAEVADGCKLLSGCRKVNLSPLQEQHMLLVAEPSFLQHSVVQII